MTRSSRRKFLKRATALGGVTLLSPYFSLARSDPPVPAVADTSELVMAIARWQPEAEGDVRSIATKLTQEAMTALGGMARFVAKGDVVWIKPNIGWNRAPELAANTNPDVVATLARLCLEAGAKKVKVGDNSCHPARQTYRTSGIEVAVREAGAEMVYLDDRRFKDVDLGGKQLSSWPLYPEAIEADLLINVPIVKHHGLSRVSLCMKNTMGIAGGDRGRWHQALPNCLVDINAYLQPQLCILDAVRILTGHGPQGGNLADVKRLHVVAAGRDIVALDSFGAELLGHEPAQIDTIRAGHAAGLGQMDYRQVDRVEVVIS